MSYIPRPIAGAKLKAGPISISGVAYNAARHLLSRCWCPSIVGKSWTPAEFDLRDSPYSWYEWKTEKTLGTGTHEIWARATDGLGRSQPLDGKIFWNPNGYEWTGIFKNEVTVS